MLVILDFGIRPSASRSFRSSFVSHSVLEEILLYNISQGHCALSYIRAVRYVLLVEHGHRPLRSTESSTTKPQLRTCILRIILLISLSITPHYVLPEDTVRTPQGL